MHPRSFAPLAVAFLCFIGGTPRALAAQGGAPALARELDSLIASLSARDPRTASGQAALLAAEGEARVGLPRDPLSLEAEVENFVPGDSPTEAQQLKVSLASPLYRGGRAGVTRAALEASTEATRAQRSLSQAVIRADLRMDLVSWLAWRGIEERLEAQDSLFLLTTDVLNARFSVGRTRYLDVLRLRTERLQVARARAEAQVEAAAHLAEARVIAAADPELAAHLDAQLKAWSDRNAWIELLPLALTETASPADSIVARMLATQRSAIDAEAARARAQRNLGIDGSLGFQRFVGTDGKFAMGPTFGLTVALPFSLTGTYGRERAAIDLRRTADSAETAAAEGRWRVERQRATLARSAAQDRLRLFDEVLLAGAAEERESALAGFRIGSISLLELIDFEQALAGVERDRLLTILEVIATDQALVEAADRSFASPDPDPTEGRTP